MRKIAAIILSLYTIFLTGLVGCGTYSNTNHPNTDQLETLTTSTELSTNQDEFLQNEITWDFAINNYPYATYDEIKSGMFKNQYVIISVVLESSDFFAPMNWLMCYGWYLYNDTYLLDDLIFECDELQGYSPEFLKPGDNVDICVYINSDNSFGNDIIAFNIEANQLSLSKIHDTFKENCIPLNYEDVVSNSKEFRGTDFVLTGEIYRIISKSDSYIEFILYTAIDNKYVYVYYNHEKINEIVIRNTITIYGTFYILKSVNNYDNIPSIVAAIVELSEDNLEYDPAAPPTIEPTDTPVTVDNVGSTNDNNFNTYNNTEQQNTEDTWVLNTNTKKIHYPSCRSVSKIAPQNYSTSSESLDDLKAKGYTTCGNCFK